MNRTLLGMLTPSSNTTLEPVTTAMIAGLPEASAHFGRFRVTEIALSANALGQFDDSEILRAAELLAHARVDVIGWNGTSSGWLGFDADERLCRRVTEAAGIPACTSVLALNEIFDLTGVTRFGLVTPYRDDVQAAIVKNYAVMDANAFGLCKANNLPIVVFNMNKPGAIARVLQGDRVGTIVR